jgi:high-affinity iron transporter
MGASFLITFRDGTEAALIVAIVAAYLRQSGRWDQRGPVFLGTMAAVVVSLVIGVVAFQVFGGLDGDARTIVLGCVMVFAAAVLTWMIFWMSKQARNIKGELHQKVDEAISGGSRWALAGVAFFAVLREGIEVVLFLLAVSRTGSSPLARTAGGVLGILVAVGVGFAVYHGGRKVNLRLLFRITGVIVVLFAAGLLSRAMANFQVAGVFPTYWYPVFDLSHFPLLSTSNQVGAFVVSLFGWDPLPSIEELLVYVAYLVPAGIFFWRATAVAMPRPASAERVRSAA